MSSSTPTNPSTADKWASGTILFTGVVLILIGAFQVLTGISAIRKDEVFVVGAEYLWKLDLTTWGWIHLLIGAALLVVAIFLLRGAFWAAVIAIPLAALSILANFLWLPYQPLWSIIIIAFNVLVIWAIATRRETIHLIDD